MLQLPGMAVEVEHQSHQEQWKSEPLLHQGQRMATTINQNSLYSERNNVGEVDTNCAIDLTSLVNRHVGSNRKQCTIHCDVIN